GSLVDGDASTQLRLEDALVPIKKCRPHEHHYLRSGKWHGWCQARHQVRVDRPKLMWWNGLAGHIAAGRTAAAGGVEAKRLTTARHARGMFAISAQFPQPVPLWRRLLSRFKTGQPIGRAGKK